MCCCSVGAIEKKSGQGLIFQQKPYEYVPISNSHILRQGLSDENNPSSLMSQVLIVLNNKLSSIPSTNIKNLVSFSPEEIFEIIGKLKSALSVIDYRNALNPSQDGSIQDAVDQAVNDAISRFSKFFNTSCKHSRQEVTYDSLKYFIKIAQDMSKKMQPYENRKTIDDKEFTQLITLENLQEKFIGVIYKTSQYKTVLKGFTQQYITPDKESLKQLNEKCEGFFEVMQEDTNKIWNVICQSRIIGAKGRKKSNYIDFFRCIDVFLEKLTSLTLVSKYSEYDTKDFQDKYCSINITQKYLKKIYSLMYQIVDENRCPSLIFHIELMLSLIENKIKEGTAIEDKINYQENLCCSISGSYLQQLASCMLKMKKIMGIFLIYDF